MQLTDEHIRRFQELYKQHFGIEIETEEALERGLRLIRLVETVFKHDSDDSVESESITH